MTRKSKQPGGHNPLTYAETKRLKSSGYGTQSTRLTSDSQLPFGHCCLSLSPVSIMSVIVMFISIEIFVILLNIGPSFTNIFISTLQCID